jgi:hypothetical protein
MDELARWAETVGGKGPRDWVDVEDPDLTAVFERVYSQVLGTSPRRDLLQISTAPGAVRVTYSGSTIMFEQDDDNEAEDLRETIEHAAFTLADSEQQNEWH